MADKAAAKHAGKSTEEMLAELLAHQEAVTRRGRIMTLACVLCVGALLIALAVLVPKTVAVFEQVEQSLVEIDSLMGDATVLIDNANTMVTDNADSVSSALKKIDEVDIDNLNSAIQGLAEAVKPLQELAAYFNR